MNAIEIKNVTKKYKDFTLDDLTLTLPGGCILGLIGENGAGKSTTIRLLLDMGNPDSGEITMLGQPNTIASLREDIGVVLDEVGLPGFMNARQIGKVMAGVYARWDDGAYQGYLLQFALPDNKPFSKLSRGMKMKMGLAVALSHHPRLLLLDEATSGLDPVVREEILDIFEDFTRDENHSILISSHIVSDLEKICDYIAFLHKGKLMLCEEKDRLRENYAVVHCSAEALKELPSDAVVGTKQNTYGAEAMVRREAVPAGWEMVPADIEQLFVYMVKGERV